MKKVYLLLIGCFVFSSAIIAQNRNVIQIEVENNDSESDSKKAKREHGFSVKLNPLLFFRGDVPIYVEKRLMSNVAIEGGIGFTHTDYFSVNSNIFSGFVGDDDISNEMGVSGRIGVRYYASDYGYQSEGAYFAIEYRLQRYNSVLNSYNGVLGLNEKLNRTNSDFRLTIGYVEYIGENFYIEPYAGFGIRNRSVDYVNGGTSSSNIDINSEKDMLPFLSLGFKVGIAVAD